MEVVPTNLRNGTPDSAKYLFCGSHQNEPKQLPSLVVIVLNKNLPQKSNACTAILRKGTKRNRERSISKLIKMSHNGLVESPDQLQPNFVPYQI